MSQGNALVETLMIASLLSSENIHSSGVHPAARNDIRSDIGFMPRDVDLTHLGEIAVSETMMYR